MPIGPVIPLIILPSTNKVLKNKNKDELIIQTIKPKSFKPSHQNKYQADLTKPVLAKATPKAPSLAGGLTRGISLRSIFSLPLTKVRLISLPDFCSIKDLNSEISENVFNVLSANLIPAIVSPILIPAFEAGEFSAIDVI